MSKPKRKVLIVEDEPVSYITLSMLLTLLGHDLVIARTGRRAVQLASRHFYKLILMDVNLPDMTGIEATAQIRRGKFKKLIPIVAVTSHKEQAIKKQCFEAGMNGFANKPMTKDQLKEVIEKYSSLE